MKIPYNHFVKFTADWKAGKYPNERFGQAYMNHVHKDLQDPRLFYMQQFHETYVYITARYVAFE